MNKEKPGSTPEEIQDGGAPAAEEPVDGGKETKEQEVNPYEAELNKLKSEKENLQKALHEERQSKKTEIKEPSQEETDDEVERADRFVVERAKRVLEPELSKLRQEMTATTRQSLLNQMTSDVKERELIDFHYQNSIVSTGDLQSDLRKAWALANAYKVEQAAQKRVEDGHRRSVQADNATALAGGNSSGGRYETDKVRLSKEDIELASKMGKSEKWLRERMK